MILNLSRYHDLQTVPRVPTEDGSSCTSVVHANSLNGSKTQPVAYGSATACSTKDTKDNVDSGLAIMRERGKRVSRADDKRKNCSYCYDPLLSGDML